MKYSLVAVVVLGTLACADAASAPTANGVTPPPSVLRQVVPSSTDASIDVADEPHYALNPDPAVAAKHKLFVFLPGTGALPSMYQAILRTGAARGYHAIGLNYPNPTAIGVLCGDDTDPECFWDTRREVITGANTSARIQVSVANSITNRLRKLLASLDAKYPTEGWGEFLSGAQVDWSRVTLAGHSQGGGHVGVLAKLVSLDRAVYFSSPADWRSVADAPATWVSRPNVTDASRQFGLTHVQDQLVPYAHVQSIWVGLGLLAYGAPVSVDATLPPFANSHFLTTVATPVIAGSYHGATVVDAATPRLANGSPALESAWAALCFP